jgi:pimeloyl-ACP methyl ester carboxylesterase
MWRKNVFVLKTATAVTMVLILTAGCAGAALPPTPMLPSVTSVPPTTTAASPASTATPTPTQTLQGQIVSFTAEDGVKLSGTLFLANGETAVVLAHMGIADQKSWQPFAGHIAGRGFTALTFDFRCFGLSDCGKMGQSESLFTQDIRAAIRFLRERGSKRIACMGASMGGTACMNAALDEELAGMVVIASPAPLYMGKQYPEDLVNPAMPKLFIVADKDRYAQVVPAISSLYDRSPEPKKLKTFPGTVHGTELFATDSGAELRDLLTHFMKELATSAGGPAGTPTPAGTRPASRAPGLALYKNSFESGISQWQQRVGMLNHTTSEYHTTPGAAKMTTARPDGFGGYSGTSGHCIDLGSELEIRPGAGSQKHVIFEAYLKTDESIMAANLGVYFHTALGCKGTYTTDTSPAGVGKSQDWTLVSTAGAIPDTTQSIDIVVHAMGMNNSASVYIDDIQVHASSANPAKP